MRHSIVAIAVSLLGLCAAAPLGAQSPEDDAAEGARFRLGPIRFTPAIAITSLGVDTNVFNTAVDPEQDVTAVFGPKVDYWLRLGRARLSGSSTLDYAYFKEFESQRSFGTTQRLRLAVPLTRVTPFVEGTFTSTRQRPGYEIDARARRQESGGRAGLDLHLTSKSTVRLAAGRAQYRFDANDTFLDQNLSTRLDRDSDVAQVEFRQKLTPLTTFVVAGERQQDRFVYSPQRDADSIRVMPGFEFKPFALIDGSVAVGYRQFDTTSALVPDFEGIVADADLGYTLRATRFTVRTRRDIEYSFEALDPYYVLTDVNGSVTQRITSRWDLVARGGRHRLDYGAVSLDPAGGRVDRGWLAGGGVGLHLGEQLRLGVEAIRYVRESSLAWRQYEAWRIGGSFTYGVKNR